MWRLSPNRRLIPTGNALAEATLETLPITVAVVGADGERETFAMVLAMVPDGQSARSVSDLLDDEFDDVELCGYHERAKPASRRRPD